MSKSEKALTFLFVAGMLILGLVLVTSSNHLPLTFIAGELIGFGLGGLTIIAAAKLT